MKTNWGEGQYRVCDTYTIQSLELGWTLVESFVIEKIEYDGSGHKIPLKKLEFLMFKPREVVESDALKQCELMKAMLCTERETHSARHDELEKCKRDYLLLEAEFKGLKLQYANLHVENGSHVELLHRLELDIAKIRKAIGDMRMSEIVGNRDK